MVLLVEDASYPVVFLPFCNKNVINLSHEMAHDSVDSKHKGRLKSMWASVMGNWGNTVAIAAFIAVLLLAAMLFGIHA